MKKRFFGCLFFFSFFIMKAQTPDLLRLEYTVIPQNNAGVQTSRYRAVFNTPIKLSDKSNYLIAGAEYNEYHFDIHKALDFDTAAIESLHVIDINLGYTFEWNDDWIFIGLITPRLASNFESGIVRDDFMPNAAVAFMKEQKDIEKPYRLLLGLSYNSATGLPYPLPLINYNKRFHSNWSYSVGVPRCDFKYYSTNQKHITQAALFLDAYFVNLQNDVLLPNDNLGSTVSLSALVGAVGYQYKFTKEISLYSILGYSLVQEGVLRDVKNDAVFTLNNKGNIYLRTGFKIGIF